MKILSWNILHGGGKRIADIIDAIKRHQPDIVTLQEFRHSSSKEALLNGLTELGLAQQIVPETNSARENTLVIASRYKFKATPFPGNSIPTHAIQATFPEIDGGLNLIAVHLPHKKLQIPYFHALLDLPKSVKAENSIIIGDFNSGIPFEDSETKSFYATHLFQQLLTDGWIDAWRSRNKKKREFTWISTKQQNGFRYDHALVSPSFDRRTQEVRYDHQVRLNGISDHSLMILDSK